MGIDEIEKLLDELYKKIPQEELKKIDDRGGKSPWINTDHQEFDLESEY